MSGQTSSGGAETPAKDTFSTLIRDLADNYQLAAKLKSQDQDKLTALISELEDRKKHLADEIQIRKQLSSTQLGKHIPVIPVEQAARSLDLLSANYLSKRLGLGTEFDCNALFKELLAASSLGNWLKVRTSPLVDFLTSNNLVQHKVEDGLWLKMW